jgi:hypothetical protein
MKTEPITFRIVWVDANGIRETLCGGIETRARAEKIVAELTSVRFPRSENLVVEQETVGHQGEPPATFAQSPDLVAAMREHHATLQELQTAVSQVADGSGEDSRSRTVQPAGTISD